MPYTSDMSAASDIDVAVVGGGVVGLSIAYELARAGREVAVLEKRARLGEGQSTRNSQVIHAGIYYEPGSLRARLCVPGRQTLVQRLNDWRIDHELCGKLIVAVEPNEIAQLETLLQTGRVNGVDDLELIDAAAVRKREPHVAAEAALWSPSSGIFDAAEYLKVLAGRAQEAGALLLTDAEVIAVERKSDEIVAVTENKGAVTCRVLVNAAGLYADDVARLCGDDRHTIYPCRGEYAMVIPAKARLVNGLVYPTPGTISLGVHLTKTVHGELWVGPNANFIEHKENYEWARLRPAEFFPEAHRLCPALRESDLRMGHSGIRAKRYGPGEPRADYLIEPQPDDGRIVHLVGIESPGLTAAPAIGEMVRDMVAEKL